MYKPKLYTLCGIVCVVGMLASLMVGQVEKKVAIDVIMAIVGMLVIPVSVDRFKNGDTK